MLLLFFSFCINMFLAVSFDVRGNEGCGVPWAMIS